KNLMRLINAGALVGAQQMGGVHAMTWAIEHPQRHRRFGRNRSMETLPAAGVRAWARPLGAAGVGLWTLLLAAWGGISVFVGPLFGYRPTSTNAWDWTMQNWLLHLVPGAVGVFAGLVMLATIGARGAGRRSGLGLASLLTVAAGAWFVIGPSAYHWFESAAAFAPTASARRDFLNQLGSNLGPGVLLAVLGGMALKAGFANPKVVLERDEEAAPAGAGAVPAGAVANPARAGGGPDAEATSASPPATARSDAAPGTSPAASESTIEDRAPRARET
ncbi:MAG TPA: hypothetical protein VFV02_10650, partial [Acidimicrobiales bacterium]|nr:hypothetical protein [Acidimicrobiales bacterium]